MSKFKYISIGEKIVIQFINTIERLTLNFLVKFFSIFEFTNFLRWVDSKQGVFAVAAVLATSPVTFYTLYKVTNSYLHEIGHSIFIRLFDRKSNIIIALRGNGNLKICKCLSNVSRIILNIECVIGGVKLNDRKAEVVVEGEYMQFTNPQLRVIASGGYILNIINAVIISLVLSQVYGNFYYVFVAITFICVVVCFLTCKKKDNWTDAKIILMPKEFKEAIMHGEIKGNSYETYKSMLQDYSKKS